jgi:aldehyde:ferredoxin oxidoreductase
MGSKNLKAVACRGRKRVEFADQSVVSEIGKWVRENAPINDRARHEFGTASLVKPLNVSGGLPTNNFRYGSFARADKISGEAMKETIFKKRRSCFACPIQCKREVEVAEPYTVNPRYGGPEYETLAALGSNCGIDDLKAISKGNELVNAYGVDSISCGATISFAMECFERGVLTKEDTGGLDLRFGNAEAMLALLEQIIERKGLGILLSEGSVRAAKKIGVKAEESLFAIKGQEMPMHDPRLKQGLGLGFAMSPTGADHCHNMHDTSFVAMSAVMKEMAALGITNPLLASDLSPAKVRLLTYYTEWMHFLNSAVCCYFVVVYGNVGFERMTRLVTSVTGWNTSLFELMKIGERAMNLSRIFNIREGFTLHDDLLPQGFFQKQPSGPLKIAVDPDTFTKAKDTYYGMLGWDSGVPSRAKLAELDIEWAADYVMRGRSNSKESVSSS